MNMDSDSAAKAADEPDWLMDEPLEHAGTASERPARRCRGASSTMMSTCTW
jgi:hypothetical protein